MNEAIKNLNLNTPKNEVLQLFGEPKKEYKSDQFEVLQYTSIAPSLADLLYFSNGSLVLKEMSVKNDQLILNGLIAQYGNPSAKYHLYGDEFKDSFSTTVFVWFDRGIDAIVFGELGDSQVLTLRSFDSLSENEYELGFGKLWAQRKIQVVPESITVVQSKQLQMTQEEARAIQQVQDDLTTAKNMKSPSIIIISFIILILVIFALGLIWKKRQKSQNLQPPQESVEDQSVH